MKFDKWYNGIYKKYLTNKKLKHKLLSAYSEGYIEGSKQFGRNKMQEIQQQWQDRSWENMENPK